MVIVYRIPVLSFIRVLGFDYTIRKDRWVRLIHEPTLTTSQSRSIIVTLCVSHSYVPEERTFKNKTSQIAFHVVEYLRGVRAIAPFP